MCTRAENRTAFLYTVSMREYILFFLTSIDKRRCTSLLYSHYYSLYSKKEKREVCAYLLYPLPLAPQPPLYPFSPFSSLPPLTLYLAPFHMPLLTNPTFSHYPPSSSTLYLPLAHSYLLPLFLLLPPLSFLQFAPYPKF